MSLGCCFVYRREERICCILNRDSHSLRHILRRDDDDFAEHYAYLKRHILYDIEFIFRQKKRGTDLRAIITHHGLIGRLRQRRDGLFRPRNTIARAHDFVVYSAAEVLMSDFGVRYIYALAKNVIPSTPQHAEACISNTIDIYDS